MGDVAVGGSCQKVDESCYCAGGARRSAAERQRNLRAIGRKASELPLPSRHAAAAMSNFTVLKFLLNIFEDRY